jgi:hypothetical protein
VVVGRTDHPALRGLGFDALVRGGELGVGETKENEAQPGVPYSDAFSFEFARSSEAASQSRFSSSLRSRCTHQAPFHPHARVSNGSHRPWWMDGGGLLLTRATRRLPPAKAVEPERRLELLACSLRGSRSEGRPPNFYRRPGACDEHEATVSCSTPRTACARNPLTQAAIQLWRDGVRRRGLWSSPARVPRCNLEGVWLVGQPGNRLGRGRREEG